MNLKRIYEYPIRFSEKAWSRKALKIRAYYRNLGPRTKDDLLEVPKGKTGSAAIDSAVAAAERVQSVPDDAKLQSLRVSVCRAGGIGQRINTRSSSRGKTKKFQRIGSPTESIASHSTNLLSLQETLNAEQDPFRLKAISPRWNNMSAAQAKSKRISAQKSQRAPRQQVRAISQNQPKSTKKQPRTIVPPPQSARIMQRYIGGDSIREIAREERRDRATVTKIVRSDEMNAVVQKMRERYYGLGFDALDAIQHTLQVQKDGRLGRQVLVDIGVAPSPAEIYAVASQLDKATLTPFEIAVAEDEDGQINRVAYGMACALEEAERCYGIPMPTPEQYRHLRRVVKVADEITGGRFDQICMNDAPEEKRIRQLATDIVEGEDARRALPPHRVQRALRHKKQLAILHQVSTRS